MVPPHSDEASFLSPCPSLSSRLLSSPPSLPLSVRAVGYRMTPSIHGGGDSWAHPAGGISVPSPQS